MTNHTDSYEAKMADLVAMHDAKEGPSESPPDGEAPPLYVGDGPQLAAPISIGQPAGAYLSTSVELNGHRIKDISWKPTGLDGDTLHGEVTINFFGKIDMVQMAANLRKR